jgi:excisionase family DNA binding protein
MCAIESAESATPRLLKVVEVSRQLSLSRSAVYGLMDAGSLAYVKLGKSRRIPAESLKRLIAANTIGSK